MKTDDEQISEYLREQNGRLHHREGQELEFKEQYNFAGLAEYLRDFAAFANIQGGYLIFGVSDSPRKAEGLNETAAAQFDKIDPEKISGFILNIFSQDISWKHDLVEYNGKKFGYFRIFQSTAKPVIAKKDDGKDQEIRNGDIYYRYGGRTQRIQSAELESIINNRVERTNNSWINLMGKIGRIGPQNAAILDVDAGKIEGHSDQVLVIDNELAKKLTFIKEGSFSEKEGATTLKLIGDVMPVDRVEVIKKEKEHLVRSYPLSATELAKAVKDRIPTAGCNQVWEAIKLNDIKDNTNYSAYNFRNKKQEDEYKESGILARLVPSIYNQRAVEFICKILDEK